MGGTTSSPGNASTTAETERKDASSQSDSKCPIDHSKMSKKQLAGFMHPFTSSSDENASTAATSPTESSKSSCPVDHKNMSKSQLDALKSSATASVKSVEAMSKASKQTPTGKDVTYDVYGQEIDSANMMPATPNQLPSPGQIAPLSTAREASTIPKSGAGDGETWTYPSPQMFFNSLKRKGKADDVREDDMDSVVAVHNIMNERTWSEVVAWENRFHCIECPNPKLKRFQGRPHDLSPTARFRTLFRGYPVPFDRHDWVIDRCGIADARYIIDYYYREERGQDPIEIHVRPAIDSPTALWDRLRAASPFSTTSSSSAPKQHVIESATHPVVAKDEVPVEEYEFLRTLTPEGILAVSDVVRTECAGLGESFRKCRENGEACEEANVSLNYCMARQICKPAATRFMQVLENEGDEVRAYEDMTACLDRFHIMARRVMMHAAGKTQLGPEFPTQHAPASAVEDA